ncbi:biotin carboxylase N-terminal domain-containing protein [Nocardioides zhouii]|uniref:Acetyl/propionyl-CoA carboxylase subunit alpha n=1 Tax=Nocardioides zhouii TaxID=1168729 RepID=A0A4Q2T439_9ACTN|nr:biotin carboxylase N-terminal domain-containing protein [Nocardioides zhouii]RYC11499.1 acetyl/propionyl-CoA carboxylase subunit alpha [Nocardioides zhouii]
MSSLIQRVAVANRGEIASRVFATCRRLGIESQALYSDPDAGLPYVDDADVATRLPGSTPAETYLDAERVIHSIRAVGGQSVHPGYGFLSENADFARAVQDAGLLWLGPPPDAIEAMGSKIRAKDLMRAAGVPVLEAPEQPTEADLPLLVKASAGGGGRGMRVVRRLGDLDAEVESARAEAASAFGDGTVFVEPYVESGRHVEVQILFDTHGTGIAVGDRDCSLQRRHQKVLEEAPAPGLPDAVRAAMHKAAVAAGRAVGYVSAGTVEFLYDPAGERFWFLEMNTRLQVEHPVTECVTGIDLVAAQIGIAEGRTLLEVLGTDTTPEPRGHAIEVRLYAETPDAAATPQSGRFSRLQIPHDMAFDLLPRHGVRVDAGYADGSEVSTHYDAMLAKVIVWAADRPSALRALGRALRRSRLHGPVTNRDLLETMLQVDEVVAGTMTTTTLEQQLSGEHPIGGVPAGDTELGPYVAAVAIAVRDAAARRVQHGIQPGWRNVASQPQRTSFEVPGRDEPVVAEWYAGRDGFRHPTEDWTVVSATPDLVVLMVNGHRMRFEVHVDESGEMFLDNDGTIRERLRPLPRFTDPADAVASGSLLAPMPGTVVKVAVVAGAQVAAGDVVLVLEAMKMQHTVTAPHAGTVTEINVEPGTQVASGEVLAVVEENS